MTAAEERRRLAREEALRQLATEVAARRVAARAAATPPPAPAPAAVPARRPSSRWAGRLAAAGVAVVAVAVLVVSVGPWVLPYRTHHVRSGSMAPAIDTGDLVFSARVDAADVAVGDVLTFDRPDRPGMLVTHRVVEVEEGGSRPGFRTRGDANPVRDAWVVPAQGRAWRYALRVPKLGYAFAAVGSPVGRGIVLLVGLAVLAAAWWRRRRRGRA